MAWRVELKFGEVAMQNIAWDSIVHISTRNPSSGSHSSVDGGFRPPPKQPESPIPGDYWISAWNPVRPGQVSAACLWRRRSGPVGKIRVKTCHIAISYDFWFGRLAALSLVWFTVLSLWAPYDSKSRQAMRPSITPPAQPNHHCCRVAGRMNRFAPIQTRRQFCTSNA
jgi:hypothetical protein